jgi:hypothetical protein
MHRGLRRLASIEITRHQQQKFRIKKEVSAMSSVATSTTELHPASNDPSSDKPIPALSRADRMRDRLKGKITIVGDIVSPFFKEVDPELKRD